MLCARLIYLTFEIQSGLESIIELIAFLCCHPIISGARSSGVDRGHGHPRVHAHFVRLLSLPPVQLSVVLGGRGDQRCDASLSTASVDELESGYGFPSSVSAGCRSHRSARAFRSARLSLRSRWKCVRACGVTGCGLKESRVLSFTRTDPKSPDDTFKGQHTAFYLVSVTTQTTCVCEKE